MTKADLIRFERQVSDRFEHKEINGPIHLSGGNEDQLIEIFKDVKSTDWVFSTWRNHYHALLHGIPEDKVMSEIMAGRGMNLNFPEYRFMTSAIVGGIIPIAVGVAYALKQTYGNPHIVWCFVGDMTATIGVFHESSEYARRNGLPIQFVIEDNFLSCNSPTQDCWGRYPDKVENFIKRYHYQRQYPHCGIGKFVNF